MGLQYVKAEQLPLKNHGQLNEAWVRDRIAEDPAILGLGPLQIKAVEKIQPKAGRLDLLMYDPVSEKRFEVELMLGSTNESHIIRCIEYWDIERKRYPQYDHTAVLIAENITGPFLNVIGLFNSSIPLIALQMNAFKLQDNVMLQFTRVLDEVIRGEDDEEESEDGQLSDRAYWEKIATKDALAVVDASLLILKKVDGNLQLSYKRQYIGLSEGYRAENFVLFKPKKHWVRVEVRIDDKPAWREKLEAADLEVLDFHSGRRLKFRLNAEELQNTQPLLAELFKQSYDEWQA